MKEKRKPYYSTSKIRDIRAKKNLTQMDVAIRTGLSLLTIGNIERGIKEPKISTLLKIAKALNVSIDSLCHRGN